MSKDMTIYDVEKNLYNAIKEAVQYAVKNDDEPRDIDLFEIVDSVIPVYNYDLLTIAASNLDLATEDPEIYGFDGEHTAVNAIAGNLFAHLEELASEYLGDIIDELEDVTC